LFATSTVRHDALMEQPEIETKGLLVRPWRTEDAVAVFQACQDSEIQRWTPVPRPYDLAHATAFVTDAAALGWANRTAAHFGVFDAASGELLGSMGLVRMDPLTNIAELGYWTAPDARGRGVATIAGRAVATIGFDLLGVERLIWRATVGNHASRLVALRIGFSMEGTQRGALRSVDGSGARVDGWLAGMLPGDVTTDTPAGLRAGALAALRTRAFGAPMPVLPTGRGVLRAHTDDDIDEVTKASQDPETLRWTTIPFGYRRTDAEWFIRVYTREAWLQGAGAMFAIVDETGAYCGGIDLRISTGDPATGEIGFQIAPWARGRGLAPGATRTICDWGFQALGLTRIIWRAHVGNDASRRVADKAGFVYEGIQRQGCEQRGERRDAWVGALLASDQR
jgi:RimJ/RimL family protein N-acetyltransferase